MKAPPRILVVAILVMAAGNSFAADSIGNTSNGTDLKKDRFFGRPLTVLEYVISNIAAKAKELGAINPPTKSYGLDPLLYRTSEGGAGYDPQSGRTILYLEVHVAYMADPWREVCVNRLKTYLQLFNFPSKSIDPSIQLNLMRPYFGPMVELDSANAAAAVGGFLKSVITRVVFYVVEDKKLKWTRRCQIDNDTAKISYDEYRYPDK